MNLLATATYVGGISSLTEVFNHAGFPSLLQVIVRLDLLNIVGSGLYRVHFHTAAGLIVPPTSVTVPNGDTNVVMMSRELVILAGESISIEVTGQGGDDSGVTVITRVFDVTPVSQSQLLGTGATLVNHNYPTTGDMLVLDGNNAPIVGACIYIYTKADYDDGSTGPEKIVGQSITTTDGEWLYPVALSAGDYYAYIFKQGVTSPLAVPFVVT